MEVTNSILSPTHEPARHAFELRTPENREVKRPINQGRSDAARPDLVRAIKDDSRELRFRTVLRSNSVLPTSAETDKHGQLHRPTSVFARF